MTLSLSIRLGAAECRLQGLLANCLLAAVAMGWLAACETRVSSAARSGGVVGCGSIVYC